MEQVIMDLVEPVEEPLEFQERKHKVVVLQLQVEHKLLLEIMQ